MAYEMDLAALISRRRPQFTSFGAVTAFLQECENAPPTVAVPSSPLVMQVLFCCNWQKTANFSGLSSSRTGVSMFEPVVLERCPRQLRTPSTKEIPCLQLARSLFWVLRISAPLATTSPTRARDTAEPLCPENYGAAQHEGVWDVFHQLMSLHL